MRILFLAITIFSIFTPNIILASPTYEKLFSLKDKALGVSSNGTLDLISIKGATTETIASIPFSDHVWAASQGETRIAIATGMKRGELTAPTRVTSYSKELSDPKIIFEFQGERNQPYFLKEINKTWWFGYFDSKYITKLGTLDPNSKTFSEFYSTRVGDAVDVNAGLAFVGRAYGDELGQDGDVFAVINKVATLLPSYRGVRALKIIDQGSNPRVLIADGWHQNYGKFAQGRISLLNFNASLSKYELSILHKDPNQYGFSKLELCGDSVLALGNKGITQVMLFRDNQAKSLISRESDQEMLDFAVINNNNKGCLVIYSDKLGIKCLKVDLITP